MDWKTPLILADFEDTIKVVGGIVFFLIWVLGGISAATKKAFTTINTPIRSNPHIRCDALSTQTFPVRVSCCAPLSL